MRGIIKEGCSIWPDEFKNDSTMTMEISQKLKIAIVKYLKLPAPGLVGDCAMLDPVTGECYSHENIIRQADGFEWSSGAIYAFEKYNIKLSDEFMNFMKSKFEQN